MADKKTNSFDSILFKNSDLHLMNVLLMQPVNMLMYLHFP